jgi:hypothetical protein
MQVYNLTDDANFDPGIYVWEGAQWKAVTPASSATVTADNGLTKTGSNIQLGGDLTQATTLGLGTSHTLGLTGTAAVNIANPLNLAGNLRYKTSATNGHVLTTDASGNADWKAAPVTTANNGLSMSGTTAQLGGTLTKNTALDLSSHTLGLTGTGAFTIANPATLSGATTVSGALTISSGSPGANKVLTSNASGLATWQTPAAPAGVTADNGLTTTGDTIQLGGSLTKETTVTLGANNLLLNATGAGKMAIGDTSSLNSSAILEVNSTDKGVLLPRVALLSNIDQTTIPNPVLGLTVYNTASPSDNTITPGLVTWDGSSWRRMLTEIYGGSSLAKLPLVSLSNITINGTLMTQPVFGSISIK